MSRPPFPGELGSDWISRVTVPDIYPRKYDPFRPAGANPPAGLPPDVAENPEIADFYGELTSPGSRPLVFQRAINYTLSILAANTPVPIMNQDTPCDSIVLDVLSTTATSAFVGFGSGVTVTSGIEVRPGLPIVLAPDNTREPWEIQKPLELIAALLARQAGIPSLGPYRSPRVVMNAKDYYVVAAGAMTLAVMLFFVPDQQ